MKESGMNELLALLFEGEGELQNVKFLPGKDRGLTTERLAGAGADMIRAAKVAWQEGAESQPPRTNTEKRQLMA